MRYVDLAVAALIGASAIAGIFAWEPATGDAGAAKLGRQVRLRDALLGVLQEHGISWILASPPDAFCAYLESRSNSTFGIAATIGGFSCGSPPPRGSVVANLSMRLVPSEVTLQAWSLA